MRHAVGFGVGALVALLAVQGCEKNGQTELRPASGTDSRYRAPPAQDYEAPTNGAVPEYPRPGSGTGVPGRQTTPGSDEPSPGGLEPDQPEPDQPGSMP